MGQNSRQGAVEEIGNGRRKIQTIGGKGVWKLTAVKHKQIPTITWTWATYVKDLMTEWYKLKTQARKRVEGKTL